MDVMSAVSRYGSGVESPGGVHAGAVFGGDGGRGWIWPWSRPLPDSCPCRHRAAVHGAVRRWGPFPVAGIADEIPELLHEGIDVASSCALSPHVVESATVEVVPW